MKNKRLNELDSSNGLKHRLNILSDILNNARSKQRTCLNYPLTVETLNKALNTTI